MGNVYRVMFLGRFSKIMSCVKITFSDLNNTVQTKVFFKLSKIGLFLFEKVYLLTGWETIQIYDLNQILIMEDCTY